MKGLMKLSSSEIFELFLSEAPHSGMNVLKACAFWSQNLFWIGFWKQSKDPACVPSFPRGEEYLSLGFTMN